MKILVANRGEVACRIIHTIQKLGHQAVAVFSEADRHALHVKKADIAEFIGESEAVKSYLNAASILEAAKKSGATMICPGYGFLSEREDFARACADKSIVFVGPKPETIALMGDKSRAKDFVRSIEEPCTEGFEVNNFEKAQEIAEKIGFPLMLKAVHGGGGRGIRWVEDAENFHFDFERAQSEAKASFGRGELFIEKAIVNARHVEVQVFGDRHGNVVHLGERDCTLQRRNQKIIEESPCSFISQATRERILFSALNIAKKSAYQNAGTVEFLVDRDENFYFLEMNTRLQVEHPVTEMVTGLDLVEWQIRIALGERLPLKQEEIYFSGHAIEVRLCAESPEENFTPQIGFVEKIIWPKSARCDVGIEEKQEVSAFYDSMLAKVITHGGTREESLQKMAEALEELVFFGIPTNQYFLYRTLQSDFFQSGNIYTHFLSEEFLRKFLNSFPGEILKSMQLLAAQSLVSQSAWTNALSRGSMIFLKHRDQINKFRSVEPNDVAKFCIVNKRIYVQLEGRTEVFEDVSYERAATKNKEDESQVLSPLSGRVIALHADVGKAIKRGAPVAVVEAMKMEHVLFAKREGVVHSILVKEGASVQSGQVLVTIA